MKLQLVTKKSAECGDSHFYIEAVAVDHKRL